MQLLARVSILSLGTLSLASVGCYTVEFDEQVSDAYYCTADDECLATQACSQFRCVDDRGPGIEISGPEKDPPTEVGSDEPNLNVTLQIADFTLDEGTNVRDGFGKVLLTIDPHAELPISQVVDTKDSQIDLGMGLAPGAHRLIAQATYGDGTPYANPSAKDYVVFFATEPGPRPQVAILEPEPSHVHVVGQPLQVTVANRNFEFVNNSADCHVPNDCDPFGPDAATCVPIGDDADEGCTEVSTAGHTHIYLLPNYPDCLLESPVNCNFDYIATVRPEESEGDGTKVSALINGEEFPDDGNFTLTAALQYSDHDPYPNKSFVIFDQIPLTIVKR